MWSTYQALDGRQSFEIVGQWGFDSQQLKYSGTLHYQPDAIQLLLTGGDLGIAQHQQTYVYGCGTVVITNAEGTPTYLPVKVSLSGLYPLQQQQTLQGNQQQVVLSYGVLGMALGAYVTADTKLTALKLDLANLTAWLQPAPGSVLRSAGAASLPTFQVTVAGRQYQLLTTTEYLMGNLSADHLFSGFKGHQSIGIALPAGGSKLQNASLLAKQVEDWFAVISGQPTAVVRLVGQLADSDTSINLFEAGTAQRVPTCDFRFTRAAIPRDRTWLRGVALSLQNWLTTYEKLLPLATTLNPTRPVVDINCEIQGICNCLNVVFDQFYKQKGRKKDVYYRHKVKIILDNCDRQYVQCAMQSLPVVHSINQLLDLIRDARNVSAHSSLAISGVPGLTTASQKYQFQLVMKTLLRLWLLQQLGLPAAILAAEVRLAQPFEVAMTQTW